MQKEWIEQADKQQEAMIRGYNKRTVSARLRNDLFKQAKLNNVSLSAALEIGIRSILSPKDEEGRIREIEDRLIKIETRSLRNSVEIRNLKGST